jgi:hypothetical protein
MTNGARLMLASGAMSLMKLKLSFVKRCVDHVWRTDQEERMAVRGRTHDRLGADIAAATRPVFNHKRLAKSLR